MDKLTTLGHMSTTLLVPLRPMLQGQLAFSQNQLHADMVATMVPAHAQSVIQHLLQSNAHLQLNPFTMDLDNTMLEQLTPTITELEEPHMFKMQIELNRAFAMLVILLKVIQFNTSQTNILERLHV
jgi:hypothetical protein